MTLEFKTHMRTAWLDDDNDDDEKGRLPDMPMTAGPVQNALFKSRTVLVFGEVDMRMAERVTAQLTALANENDQPIRVIINSPGGHVESGDTIHDMIRFCGPQVKVIGTGWVASAGAHIYLGALKENRLCLPNTRFLLHQPAGGVRGQASDIQIEAEEIIKMRDRVNRMIAKETGQTFEKVVKDTQRNFWMTAEEAKAYGLVSRIIDNTSKSDAVAAWWRGAVLYHVYVRSFFDSNGDGQGDLPGVMARLDYIKSLGVDGIWLSPIHPSPNRDWGYDVADYDGVQPDYGDLDDLRLLLDAAHVRGLKVLLDEVLAHTSDEHPWFLESLTGGPEGPKADWYVWADPQADGTAPNNWLSVFGGPAWAYQPARRQHYHHKFLRQQPKLNWRNPDAREAALTVLDTWLARGVDGFRLDVANAFLHDAALTDNPAEPEAARTDLNWSHAGNLQKHLNDSNLPENGALLDRIRRRVEAHGDRFVFGEFSEEEARCGAYLAPDEGLHSAYTFVLLLARRLTPAFVRDHYEALAQYPDHWPTVSLSNHDVPRTVSRFGGSGETPELAQMLFALLLSLKGTTLIYQGEELGLPQAVLPRDQLRDPVGDLYWPYDGGRDGCRTPIPWDESPHHGFTTGQPWLPLAAEHRGLSVASQEDDPGSTLIFAREMIGFRKGLSAMTHGELAFLETPDPVLAFVRYTDDEAIACVFNFSDEPRFVEHPLFEAAELLATRAGDADVRGASIGLAPHAAVFLRLAPVF